MAATDSLDQQILAVVQQQFGSSNYSQFQAIRYAWFSKQTYPQAGTNQLQFFGDVIGQNGVTNAQTNMKRANSFSQRYFLMRSIRVHFYMPSAQLDGATLAASYLPVLHDVMNSPSWLQFKIADKEYLNIPMPLAYMPYGTGLVGNVINNAAAGATFQSYGTIGPRKDDVFVLEPPQLIEAETTFNMDWNFITPVALPAAVTGTAMIVLDGIVFRPLQ